MDKTQVTGLAYLAFAVCGVVLILNGVPVDQAWLRYLSFANGIVVLIALAFDRWLWKLRVFRPWLVKTPDLSGTWRATLRTNWERPGSSTVEPPIEAYLAVYQTLSSLRMRLMTAQSVSQLLGSQLSPSPDGSSSIAAVYRNEPSIQHRRASPIHNGAMLLYIPSEAEGTIKGTYWTDRGTSGDIELGSRVREILDDFLVAREAITGNRDTQP